MFFSKRLFNAARSSSRCFVDNSFFTLLMFFMFLSPLCQLLVPIWCPLELRLLLIPSFCRDYCRDYLATHSIPNLLYQRKFFNTNGRYQHCVHCNAPSMDTSFFISGLVLSTRLAIISAAVCPCTVKCILFLHRRKKGFRQRNIFSIINTGGINIGHLLVKIALTASYISNSLQ